MLHEYVVFQICESVRLKVREEHYVIVILKGISEAQCIQQESLRFLIIIHITWYVLFVIFVIWLYTSLHNSLMLQRILNA